MKKNEVVELVIEDMGTDGEGIGHINTEEGSSLAVFVKDTVVGDVAKVRLVKLKKNYAYGRLEELYKPSPYRVVPVCAKARQCGGCTLMHMSYERQLAYKRDKVKNCLERIGGIKNADALIESVSGMENPYNYRNKMQFPVGLSKTGKVEIGFYAGRTHAIIDLDSCSIGHPVNHYLIKHIRNFLEKYQRRTGCFIYNEETHTGLVRHILTRVGYTTGELMVCIVINGDNLNPAGAGSGGSAIANEELRETIEQAVKEYNLNMAYATKDFFTEIKVTSLSININKDKTNRILGDRCVTLYGQDYISDSIGDVCFRISPLSFYQVNPVQTKVLYDKAMEYANLQGEETVWDLYCGIGTISLFLSQKAKLVCGVEIVPQAIADARENAKINQIENVEFFVGKAEEVLPQQYRENGIHADVIVVDPPRKGCEEIVLKTIADMQPKRLVYVSCDPATLARDVKRMEEFGYRLVKAGVVDQFCHSGHVECVVLLTKVQK